MPLLPNVERAWVPIEKLRDYSLSSEHPIGKHKARVFKSALAMSEHDAGRLRSIILKAILANEAIQTESNDHGSRYSVDFETLGTRGRVVIRTSWIIDEGEAAPRLTSCYVVK